MHKLLILMKRKAGVSTDAFVEAYERGHARFALRHLGDPVRYERLYLRPIGDAPEGDGFDVLTEVWYRDREAMEAALAHLGSPEIAAAMAEDERALLDQTRRLSFVVVDEAVSDLSDIPATPG